jgi:hypothetical protein
MRKTQNLVLSHTLFPSRPAGIMILFLLVFIGLANSLSATPVVWDVGAGGNGHTYEAILVPGGITWSQAKTASEGAGGHLATIDSEAENDFVYALIDSDSYWKFSSAWDGPWLGGTQLPGSVEPAGGWQWVTGEAFTFLKWASGQPNNSGGNQDSLHFWGASTRTRFWDDDRSITTMNGYVMEIDTQQTVPALTLPGILMLLIGCGVTIIGFRVQAE